MIRTAVAVPALLLALGACSSGPGAAEDPAPTATSDSPGTPTGTPSSATSDEPLPCVPGVEPFTGPAADEHGAEEVMAAYCLLARLVEEQEGTTLSLPIPEQRPRDLMDVAEVLTPRARREWRRQVRSRAAGDPGATERVNGLTLHDVREVPRGYQRADDGPYVFGTQVGPATAELVDRGVRLTFTMDTGLVLEEAGDDSGRHSLLPVTRRGSYVLVRDGERWLVDDWEAEFERGPVRLVVG